MKITDIIRRLSVPLLYLLLPFTSLYSYAQCSNSGPRNGTVFTDDNTIGSFAFSSPSYASVSDNNRSSASAIAILFSGQTHYLKATGFGFSIPPGASICGIRVEVQKSATDISFLATISDNSVRIIKGGSITGSNRAKSSSWPETESYDVYGGTSDLWGTTWTPSDINASNFGIAFSAEINGLLSLLPDAHINHIRMTVYYNLVLPLSLSFTAKPNRDHSAMLTWQIENSEENIQVNVQRMDESKNWHTIHSINPVQNKTGQYTDATCSAATTHYRLQLLQDEGKITYSSVIPVAWKEEALIAYPNPATHTLFVVHTGSPDKIRCFDLNGRQQPVPAQQLDQNHYRLQIHHLPPGLYSLQVDDKKTLFIKK